MDQGASARRDADEIPNENSDLWPLPKGWCWAQLRDIAALNPPTSFEELDADTSISFVPMRAVSEETGDIDVSARRPIGEVSKGYVRFRNGDVIFAKITPCMENGKIAPVINLPEGIGAGSTEFHVLRPVAVDQRYLWYWTVRRAFRHQAQLRMSGSAGQLRAVPLAPLPEPCRLSEPSSAASLRASMGYSPRSARVRRRWKERERDSKPSVELLLKAAVTGELTKDWRSANPVTETGHDLVARIKAERARKALGKGVRGRRATETPSPDASVLRELPDSWAYVTLGALFDIATGSTPSRADPSLWNGGIPWVSSGEVAFCRIHSTRETISETGLGNRVSRLHPAGTVLLAMIGEGKTRGQCAILEIPAANNQNAAAIRVSETSIPPEFVYRSLEERYFKSRQESQGGNQPALNAGKVSEMPIALPPLAEITEILRQVDDALAAASDTLTMLEAEGADAARLKQSILKAAFDGRLVPQDPADEPAAVILACTAAATQGAGSRRHGRPRKLLV
jgi:type I restriction enzyme S subunit